MSFTQRVRRPYITLIIMIIIIRVRAGTDSYFKFNWVWDCVIIYMLLRINRYIVQSEWKPIFKIIWENLEEINIKGHILHRIERENRPLILIIIWATQKEKFRRVVFHQFDLERVCSPLDHTYYDLYDQSTYLS